jgi:PIN domain nuclease of toxin-antitoxin system
MSRLLLDTCTFIWHADDPAALSPVAAAALTDPNNELFLSAVTLVEICIKVSLGKLTLSAPPEQLLHLARTNAGIVPLPLGEAAALKILSLPQIHKDPFDRMLITQALAHNLTLLTPDPLIRQYPVPTLW